MQRKRCCFRCCSLIPPPFCHFLPRPPLVFGFRLSAGSPGPSSTGLPRQCGLVYAQWAALTIPALCSDGAGLLGGASLAFLLLFPPWLLPLLPIHPPSLRPPPSPPPPRPRCPFASLPLLPLNPLPLVSKVSVVSTAPAAILAPAPAPVPSPASTAAPAAPAAASTQTILRFCPMRAKSVASGGVFPERKRQKIRAAVVTLPR